MLWTRRNHDRLAEQGHPLKGFVPETRFFYDRKAAIEWYTALGSAPISRPQDLMFWTGVPRRELPEDAQAVSAQSLRYREYRR